MPNQYDFMQELNALNTEKRERELDAWRNRNKTAKSQEYLQRQAANKAIYEQKQAEAAAAEQAAKEAAQSGTPQAVDAEYAQYQARLNGLTEQDIQQLTQTYNERLRKGSRMLKEVLDYQDALRQASDARNPRYQEAVAYLQSHEQPQYPAEVIRSGINKLKLEAAKTPGVELDWDYINERDPQAFEPGLVKAKKLLREKLPYTANKLTTSNNPTQNDAFMGYLDGFDASMGQRQYDDFINGIPDQLPKKGRANKTKTIEAIEQILARGGEQIDNVPSMIQARRLYGLLNKLGKGVNAFAPIVGSLPGGVAIDMLSDPAVADAGDLQSREARLYELANRARFDYNNPNYLQSYRELTPEDIYQNALARNGYLED